MKVSIYTVYKDYHWWLDDCIKGVLSNLIEAPDREYIFVDYGSEKIEYLDPLFQYLPHPQITFYRMGDKSKKYSFVDALQFAISRCKGKYVIRADADDKLEPEIITDMLNFNKHKDNVLTISKYYDEEGNVIDGDKLTCQALVRRYIYQYVKYLPGQKFRDGTVLLKTIEDLGKAVDYINEPGFLHREHKKSLTADKAAVEKMDKLICRI